VVVCLVEVLISASDDDVEISMDVTSMVSLFVVGISADVSDSIELDIVSITVEEIVD
jgi:hypothetical protein